MVIHPFDLDERPSLVIDTNVLISAAGWNGAPRQLYQACRDGRLKLITSLALIQELTRVLRYPKLKFTQQDISDFEQSVLTNAYVVQPTRTLEVCKDPDDNRVLECAIAGTVNVIVSGDPHLINLKSFEEIPIQSAREAIEFFGIQ